MVRKMSLKKKRRQSKTLTKEEKKIEKNKVMKEIEISYLLKKKCQVKIQRRKLYRKSKKKKFITN